MTGLFDDEDRVVSSEDATYHRGAMEQRRTVEITLFGAFVTSQFALTALVASQAGEPSASSIAWYVAVVDVILFVTYAALVIAIEWRSRENRIRYLSGESKKTIGEVRQIEGLVKTVRRAWAAWPAVAAVPLLVALIVLARDLRH